MLLSIPHREASGQDLFGKALDNVRHTTIVRDKTLSHRLLPKASSHNMQVHSDRAG